MKVSVKDVTIDLVKGDLTRQSGFDAVVNAANAWLRPGGGVSGAIHKAAGPKLYEECAKLAPIKVGQAVVTAAYGLPNKFVIHTLGPVYDEDERPEESLATCYRNSLAKAEAKGAGSVAFPAISTGVFGFPVEKAAWTALTAIVKAAGQLRSVRRIRIVLFSRDDLEVHEKVLARLTG